ncbi:unnamed protein product [Ostreobium quekettii]|uniref:Uncharacterized protein n=1 Tax=Ostreobium quekettii TaxID=121088 RepID=A0A8S1JFK8_9CHLO|nr:unnamed protein product [Ostreobium quekettii]|eukprot:evm.model.scf_2731.2 EVM.evm.TU.scf_2731.2   scf_2731:15813-18521(-)
MVTGCKEWLDTVGKEAGLVPGDASIACGAVGAPESRIELEVEFQSFGDLEAFWKRIPQDKQQDWSEGMERLVVDGSPQWSVYYSVPSTGQLVLATAESSLDAAAAQGRQDAKDDDTLMAILHGALETTSSPPSAGPTVDADVGDEPCESSDANKQVVLDWKGDPMVINPNDNLPLGF